MRALSVLSNCDNLTNSSKWFQNQITSKSGFLGDNSDSISLSSISFLSMNWIQTSSSLEDAYMLSAISWEESG